MVTGCVYTIRWLYMVGAFESPGRPWGMNKGTNKILVEGWRLTENSCAVNQGMKKDCQLDMVGLNMIQINPIFELDQ